MSSLISLIQNNGCLWNQLAIYNLRVAEYPPKIWTRENREQIQLAPVVQTLDSAIHRINHYPADKY